MRFSIWLILSSLLLTASSALAQDSRDPQDSSPSHCEALIVAKKPLDISDVGREVVLDMERSGLLDGRDDRRGLELWTRDQELFSQGFVSRALAHAMVFNEGARSAAQVRKGIEGLVSPLTSRETKERVLDLTVLWLRQLMGGSVGMTSLLTNHGVQERAKEFGVSIEQLNAFVAVWGSKLAHDSQSIKAAIYYEIATSKEAMIKAVVRAMPRRSFWVFGPRRPFGGYSLSRLLVGLKDLPTLLTEASRRPTQLRRFVAYISLIEQTGFLPRPEQAESLVVIVKAALEAGKIADKAVIDLLSMVQRVAVDLAFSNSEIESLKALFRKRLNDSKEAVVGYDDTLRSMLRKNWYGGLTPLTTEEIRERLSSAGKRETEEGRFAEYVDLIKMLGSLSDGDHAAQLAVIVKEALFFGRINNAMDIELALLTRKVAPELKLSLNRIADIKELFRPLLHRGETVGPSYVEELEQVLKSAWVEGDPGLVVMPLTVDGLSAQLQKVLTLTSKEMRLGEYKRLIQQVASDLPPSRHVGAFLEIVGEALVSASVDESSILGLAEMVRNVCIESRICSVESRPLRDRFSAWRRGDYLKKEKKEALNAILNRAWVFQEPRAWAALRSPQEVRDLINLANKENYENDRVFAYVRVLRSLHEVPKEEQLSLLLTVVKEAFLVPGRLSESSFVNLVAGIACDVARDFSDDDRAKIKAIFVESPHALTLYGLIKEVWPEGYTSRQFLERVTESRKLAYGQAREARYLHIIHFEVKLLAGEHRMNGLLTILNEVLFPSRVREESILLFARATYGACKDLGLGASEVTEVRNRFLQLATGISTAETTEELSRFFSSW